MTPEDNGIRMLRRATERAVSNPFYLAFAFAIYQQSESLDDDALARFLGCASQDLLKLALCRRPGVVGEDEFGADVAQIVSRYAIRRERLVHLLRQVEFLRVAQEMSAKPATLNTVNRKGLLLAAQDRDNEQERQHEEDDEVSS